jgi:poly-gamma-glutamate system protein
MKKLLWKPSKISWQIHVVIAICAIIGLLLVEVLKINVKQPYYKDKIRAAKFMQSGMDILKKYRIKHFGPIDKKIDPTQSGLIGILSSPITSKEGDFDSKLTTINPNWAAVMVHLLKRANVKSGNTVAISFSGSFPVINIAVLSAAKAMNLDTIIISSVSASTWGANIPEFTWLDMERELNIKGLFFYRTKAASLGGVKDSAIGMSKSGKVLLKNIIRRHGISLLDFDNIKDDIENRMEIYKNSAGENPIAAYINVGGGITAFGSLVGKKMYRAGLNQRPSYDAIQIDSVMSRFARERIPIIYMTQIKKLAKKYGLPIAPDKTPKVGVGKIYSQPEYNRVHVSLTLIALLILLYLFIRMGFGYRIFATAKREAKYTPPEPMV